MKTSDFWYDLPQELIAQTPVSVRSASRLLVYDREKKSVADGVFTDIKQYLRAGDVLVRNVTRVLPARLYATREETGGRMEILLLKRVSEKEWECLVKPGRKAKKGLRFRVNDELCAVIGDTTDAGGRVVTLEYDGIFEEVLDRAGEMPLPPYITERLSEKERYQTVYAKENGSAAAPTAGLHFTPELFEELLEMGVIVADLVLHVGLGTFRPVSAENVEVKMMHGLARIGTAVGNNAISVCNAGFLCNVRDLFKDPCNNVAVIGAYVVTRGDVSLGNNEHVNGSLGCNVAEGEHGFVFIYLV